MRCFPRIGDLGTPLAILHTDVHSYRAECSVSRRSLEAQDLVQAGLPGLNCHWSYFLLSS